MMVHSWLVQQELATAKDPVVFHGYIEAFMRVDSWFIDG